MPAATRRPRLTSLLRAVGLLGATDQKIGTFSTGMRTRLGIAASLLSDPPLLIWDEPTAGLDPAARRFTLDLISRLAETRTVIVATHILSDIDQICDHVGVMHEGRMIFSGTMREMKQLLQRDDFTLEVDGPAESMRDLVRRAGDLAGLTLHPRDERTLVVRVADSRSRASALAEVLQLLEGAGISLQSVASGQNETESAYLQLLQEDSAHGFRRFDLQRPRDLDADAGDPHV
jgi:ABC-2 type transport system ATP-binding protein